MKIVITVISMVLMVRGCCCAVNNNNTLVQMAYNASFRTTSSSLRASSSSSLRASSSSSNNSTSNESEENPLKNVIQCFKADSLFKCFNDRVGLLIRVWREALINSVRRNGDEPLTVNQGFEYTLRDISKAIYYAFTSFFYSKDDDEARSAPDDPTQKSDTALEIRSHKKKKVHKEIKKIVIKIIIAIALFLLKIKMLLGFLQSILLSKFIFVATMYLLSLIFKIWYEIKQAKLHKEHDKSVIYYDNTHDHHTYDLPEHEYGSNDEHGYSSSSWGGLWGRSYAPTQTPTVTASSAFQNAYRKPWPYYIRPKPVGSEEEEFS